MEQHLDAFLCPITQDVMLDPVITADGHCYERKSISNWFRSHNTSPLTNQKLANKTLIPNHALRNAVHEYNAIMAKLAPTLATSLSSGNREDRKRKRQATLKEMQNVMTAVDAIEAIKTALGADYDAQLAAKALEACMRVAMEESERTVLGLAPTAIQSVITLLNHYSDADPFVAKNGCRAISNLAVNNAHNKKALVEGGACEALVKAIQSHYSEASVAEWGSKAIRNLSVDDAMATVLGDANACKAIIRVMVTHPDNSDVAEWSSKACYKLCDISANVNRLVTLDAASHLKVVIDNTGVSPRAREWAGKALERLQ